MAQISPEFQRMLDHMTIRQPDAAIKRRNFALAFHRIPDLEVLVDMEEAGLVEGYPSRNWDTEQGVFKYRLTDQGLSLVYGQ